MRPTHVHRATFLLSAALAIASVRTDAHAQCQEFTPGFELRGMNAAVKDLRVLDDGGVPTLFAGGAFSFAFDFDAFGLVHTTGSTWSSLPRVHPAVAYEVTSVIRFDDGSGGGEQLFALAIPQQFVLNPSIVWKLVGAAWVPVGPADPLAPRYPGEFLIHDQGFGPQLFVSGELGVHNWDGAQWSALPPIPTGLPSNTLVDQMVSYDAGSGPELIVAGPFTGGGYERMARWDGSAWHPVGLGIPGIGSMVDDMIVFDDGSGEKVFMVGRLFGVDGLLHQGGFLVEKIATWDGSSWGTCGTGLTDGPGATTAATYAIAIHDDGSGPALFVGGSFTHAGGQPARNIAKWDGVAWSPVGASELGAPVRALASFDDGAGGGARLYAGGDFLRAGSRAARYIARLEDGDWSPLAEGHGLGGAGATGAIVAGVDPGGKGPVVFASGVFTTAGEVYSPTIAQWDGLHWEPFATSAGIAALQMYAESSAACPNLFAAGGSVVSRWDGTSWTSVGTVGGVFGPHLNALGMYDRGSGPELYIGGFFATVAGAANHWMIARWNGSSWSSPGKLNGEVVTFVEWDDGSGSKLYIGGEMFEAYNTGIAFPVNRVVSYDGTFYSPVGTNVGARVNALAVHDDGGGEKLYAGTANGVRYWTGATWTSILSLATGDVRALASFDDGTGPALYAGLVDDQSGPPSLNGLVKWDGVAWSEVDGGLTTSDATWLPISGQVSALHVANDPATGVPTLYVSGQFLRAGTEPSIGFATWRSCNPAVEPGTAFCFGDGSLATACPCSPPSTVPDPSGASNAGCANSFHLDGARLLASGSTSGDDVELRGVGQAPSSYAFFFVGTAELAGGFGVGDGVRCADGALTRFGSQFAACGSVKYPHPAIGWTLPLSSVSGTAPGSGVTKRYQVLYRNAQAGFCGAGTTNLTSAYRITW
ncbi:MAG: hypothetical protein ACKVWV_09760 [Planctomycetota bacterium]